MADQNDLQHDHRLELNICVGGTWVGERFLYLLFPLTQINDGLETVLMPTKGQNTFILLFWALKKSDT